MKNKLILGGILAAVLPAAAMAQPDPNCVASNQASRAQGTILGAGAGAVLGSVLAGRHSRGEGAVLGAVGGGVAGNVIAGNRNDPCPPGYYYGPNGGPPPGGGYPPPGAYANYGAPPEGFWRGAPADTRQRIDFLRQRIDRMSASGRISPGDSQRAYSELQSIRYYVDSNERQYGPLTGDQRHYADLRINHVAASLRWESHYGY